MDGLQALYGHGVTKFSGMGRFTYPRCSAGALRARNSASTTTTATDAAAATAAASATATANNNNSIRR